VSGYVFLRQNLTRPTDPALQFYQKGLAIAEELVAKYPLNQTLQDDLNWVRNKIEQLSEQD